MSAATVLQNLDFTVYLLSLGWGLHAVNTDPPRFISLLVAVQCCALAVDGAHINGRSGHTSPMSLQTSPLECGE